MIVPVVDFSACSLARCQIRTSEPSLSAELRAAFTQVGFVFLKNTGVTQDEVRAGEPLRFWSCRGKNFHLIMILLL